MRMNIIERTINDVTVPDIEGNLALNENARFRRPGAGAIDAGTWRESSIWIAAGWVNVSPATRLCNG
jgi:hypothetical protein